MKRWWITFMNNYQCWRAVWVKWRERDWESPRLKLENGGDTSRHEEECKCFPFPGKHESAARCGNDRTDLVIYCSVYSHTLTDGHEQQKWISLKVSALRERGWGGGGVHLLLLNIRRKLLLLSIWPGRLLGDCPGYSDIVLTKNQPITEHP